jgi:hypothetical protein
MAKKYQMAIVSYPKETVVNYYDSNLATSAIDQLTIKHRWSNKISVPTVVVDIPDTFTAFLEYKSFRYYRDSTSVNWIIRGCSVIALEGVEVKSKLDIIGDALRDGKVDKNTVLKQDYNFSRNGGRVNVRTA